MRIAKKADQFQFRNRNGKERTAHSSLVTMLSATVVCNHVQHAHLHMLNVLLTCPKQIV